MWRRWQLLLGVLRILHEALGASGALLQRGGLERDGLELGELGPDRVVSRRVVARRAGGQAALDLGRPPPRARELRARAIALFQLRPQLARPGGGAAALLEHAVPLGFRVEQLARRRSELLESLPKVLPVPGDHLELRVEQGEHTRVFRPERSLAGGTRPLGTEPHDLIALLFHLFVQFEQLGALRLGILPVPYPHRALLLRDPLDRLQPLVQSTRRRIRPGERLRHVPELGEATLEHAYVAGQLGKLRLFRAPRRRLTLQPLERRDLLLQARHGGELRAEQA